MVKAYCIILAIALLTVVSCGPQDTTVNSNAYFNIDGFFKRETDKLQKQNALIIKTAVQNQHSETEKVKVNNWANEFELFSESDINKPAWKDSYEVNESANTTTYTAKEDKLRTRKVIIERSLSRKIKHIFILNVVKNSLYSSVEELNYFPDSLYSIKKKQDVLLLGTNDYLISGKIQ